jgi:hypothetical protein
MTVSGVTIEATLFVGDWHCECGGCGYGRGGCFSSPALEGKPIIEQESESCPGCGARFVRRRLGPEARWPAPGYAGDRG